MRLDLPIDLVKFYQINPSFEAPLVSSPVSDKGLITFPFPIIELLRPFERSGCLFGRRSSSIVLGSVTARDSISFTMVVLAASIMTKTGKVLVSRQFVDMSRIRIEGLLAAFPKLVGTGKQHTFVETENVRYVYQPIEALYLLLVPEYSPSLDEEGVCKMAFELIFAFDEAISLDLLNYSKVQYHENFTVSQIEKNRGDKGGYMSFSGPRKIESTFSDMSISSSGSGFGSGSGIGLSTDVESFSSKPKEDLCKASLLHLYPDHHQSSKTSLTSSWVALADDCIKALIDEVKIGRPSASATAPSKGLGMKLGKTQKTNQFLESLKAEGEVFLEDVQPTVAQSKPSLPPTDPVTLSIEERLNVVIRRDGGLNNFDVQGTLFLQILNQEDGFVQLQIENQDVPGLNFKTHPNINKELFNSKHIVGLKDPNRPFPTGQNDVGLMKWRIQGMDEASLPLTGWYYILVLIHENIQHSLKITYASTVNCWPSVSGGETYVNIEYEASEMFDLQHVIISIPLPALREPPSVRQIDGEWKYDSKNSTLDWSILLIDPSNRSGSMEFVVPPADSSVFFPITVRFTAASTYSDVKVSCKCHTTEKQCSSEILAEDSADHRHLPGYLNHDKYVSVGNLSLQESMPTYRNHPDISPKSPHRTCKLLDKVHFTFSALQYFTFLRKEWASLARALLGDNEIVNVHVGDLLVVPPPSKEASEARGVEASAIEVPAELPSKPSPTPMSSSPEKPASPKRQCKKHKLTLAPSPKRQTISLQVDPAREEYKNHLLS
ncbi:hypothetical protein ZIOFF_024368 [Zingiber officinale]|uniref:Coatomer subunit delta n=1 Tax=Zingiber officinale TaxID=94328 RepID=A0A8J5H890_ZINOF|nr:hypothetical protein ZIOFF_024368 [Zingiber officinale]